MQYTYICAYKIYGGYTGLGDSTEEYLYKDSTTQILLTNSADEHLAELDRGLAIRSGFFRGFFGGVNNPNFVSRLRKEQHRITLERNKKIGNSTVLIIRCFGDEKLFLENLITERKKFAIYYDDSYDQEGIKQRHSKAVQSAIASISRISQFEVFTEELAEGIYFKDDKGKTVYPLRIQAGTGRITQTNLVDENIKQQISQFFQELLAKGELDTLLKVFLCHSSNDKLIVREIYQQLKRFGFKPWLDEEELIGGQDWDLEIKKAVKASDAIVVCLSKTSITKEGYVQREIKMALDMAEEKPRGTIFIIPLRLEECEVPSDLAKWQRIDLYKDDGYKKLIKALNTRAGSLSNSRKVQDTEALQGLLDTPISDSLRRYYPNLPSQGGGPAPKKQNMLEIKPGTQKECLKAALVARDGNILQFSWELRMMNLRIRPNILEKIYIPNETLKINIVLPDWLEQPNPIVFDQANFSVPNPQNFAVRQPSDAIYHDGTQLIVSAPGALNIVGQTRSSNFNITDNQRLAELTLELTLQVEFYPAYADQPFIYDFKLTQTQFDGRYTIWAFT